VSASVNLPLHHKVQKFCSGTGSPGWSRKKGRKTVVVYVRSTAMRPKNCTSVWSGLLVRPLAWKRSPPPTHGCIVTTSGLARGERERRYEQRKLTDCRVWLKALLQWSSRTSKDRSTSTACRCLTTSTAVSTYHRHQVGHASTVT